MVVATLERVGRATNNPIDDDYETGQPRGDGETRLNSSLSCQHPTSIVGRARSAVSSRLGSSGHRR